MRAGRHVSTGLARRSPLADRIEACGTARRSLGASRLSSGRSRVSGSVPTRSKPRSPPAIAKAQRPDWPQIAALYGELLRYEPDGHRQVNHAVAMAEAGALVEGFAIVEALAEDLADYQPWHAAVLNCWHGWVGQRRRRLRTCRPLRSRHLAAMSPFLTSDATHWRKRMLAKVNESDSSGPEAERLCGPISTVAELTATAVC